MSTLISFLIWLLIPLVGLGYLNFPAMLNLAAQLLVDASILTITSIEISECEETAFTMAMTSRISNTGPLPAEIDPMTVSMYAESPVPLNSTHDRPSLLRAFATVRLPAVSAKPGGTTCNVIGQRVTIKDTTLFHTFNRNLINQSELPLYITGTSTIRILGGLLSTEIKYHKTVLLKGMERLHITVLETRKESKSLTSGGLDKIEVDVTVENKSCVEMEMGLIYVGIHHANVEISNLQAKVHLRRGMNKITFRGRIHLANMFRNPRVGIGFLRKDLKGEEVHALVIGERGEKCAWIDRVVKEMNSPIVMDSTLKEVYQSTKQKS